MPSGGTATSEKVVLLFTTFPVSSETFLQREVRSLRQAGLNIQIVSLWGGDKEWNGIPIHKEGLLTALSGILWIPYYLIRKPGVFWKFLKAVIFPRKSGILNWGENLLGAGYALRRAGGWEAEGASHFHGVWASAPAMAGWFMSELTGIPFSFSGHAYDLFEKGGDGWIEGKIRSTSWVRTSTCVGKQRLMEIGADSDRIIVVRRGFYEMPARQIKGPIREPVRFVSVGRMVEKMGYARQIPLIRDLLDRGMKLEVDWIGDGSERESLERKVREAGLEQHIRIHGYLPYDRVEQMYSEADCFLFTGQIDRHGDRAGLPNVVAEAMAWGLLVFSTRVGAVEEAIQNRRTGILWQDDPDADTLIEALQNQELIQSCRNEARKWIENKFDLRKNLGPLIDQLSVVTFQSQEG